MGAMHNDLNRCNFMYSDDRRCRNLVETPGNPFCYYHNRARNKQSITGEHHDQRAARAFFDWLSQHSLDSATHLNQALNQLFLLVVGDRLSSRRADSLTRMARLMLNSIPEVRDEFNLPGLRRNQAQGCAFLHAIDEFLACASPQEPGVVPEPLAAPAAGEQPGDSPLGEKNEREAA